MRHFLSRASIEARNPYEVGPRPARRPGFHRRRRLLLRRLGLSHLLGRKLIHLSNGEQRKVLLVHALLKEPRLLVLDEPYAGLDRATRARLKRVIRDLMSGGLPVLVITSRSDEIPALATHLLLVRSNRVAAQGRKVEVLRRAGAAVRAEARTGSERRRRDETPTPERNRRPAVPGVARQKVSGRATPLVELQDVTIRYGRRPILNHFTWTLRRGENWALLGPNGSGKSTLLSLIQGDNPQAYAHRIRLFGRRRHSTQALWEARQRLGWVSPELQLHHPPEWSCLEVVCSGCFNTIGLYQPCSRAQRRAARRCLRALGLQGAEAMALGELSIGEQRLVLLGRALVNRPRLLVLDEPCQGLDAVHRRMILEVVDRAVPRTGASLIFVTHHPREMPRCITHVLELKNGRIVREGPRRR